MSLEFRTLRGKETLPYINELARLRIAVFKEFPYLYDGNMQNEKEYLHRFIESPGSTMVMVTDPLINEVVGVSTAAPLISEMEEVKTPFIDKGFKLSEIFYFSESVLLPAYRGRGVGGRFFQERERVARLDKSIKYLTFCAVQRENNHPKMPKGYKSLDHLWESQGFIKRPDITTYFAWKEIGNEEKSNNLMIFWLKTL